MTHISTKNFTAPTSHFNRTAVSSDAQNAEPTSDQSPLDASIGDRNQSHACRLAALMQTSWAAIASVAQLINRTVERGDLRNFATARRKRSARVRSGEGSRFNQNRQ
jgi:hypothetical protein